MGPRTGHCDYACRFAEDGKKWGTLRVFLELDSEKIIPEVSLESTAFLKKPVQH